MKNNEGKHDHIICVICGKEFDDRDDYREHHKTFCGRNGEKKIHEEPGPPMDGGPNQNSPEANTMTEEQKPTKDELEKRAYEIYDGGGSGPCPFCGITLESREGFADHVEAKHVLRFPYTNPNYQYKCPVCPLRFKKKQGLGRHMVSAHRKKKGAVQTTVVEEKKETENEQTKTPDDVRSLCLECGIIWVGDRELKKCPECWNDTQPCKKKVRIKRFKIEDVVN